MHIASLRDLARVAHANPEALRLAARFWPGPLTIVLPKTGAVPDEATAGLLVIAVVGAVVLARRPRTDEPAEDDGTPGEDHDGDSADVEVIGAPSAAAGPTVPEEVSR